MFRKQILPSLLCFCGILVCYALYAGVAVPMLMPEHPTLDRRKHELENVHAGSVQIPQIGILFGEDDWESKSEFLIRDKNYVFLFDEFHHAGDLVELRPCTVLLLGGSEKDEPDDRYRQAIVLKAPDHAKLKFDGEFNPVGGMKDCKFLEGRLVGPVVISSDMKHSGPEDDLYLETQNVMFSEENIQTAAPLNFRFATHYGKGRSLLISVVPSDPINLNSEKTIGKIELFELDNLVFVFDSSSNEPSQGDEKRAEHVTVTCRGSVEFNPSLKNDQQWVVSFQNQVSVLRANEGPYDQLSCSRLDVYFGPDPNAPSERAYKNNELAGLRHLVPMNVVALGTPARVRSSINEDFHAIGDRIEYDLLAGRISLESDPGKDRLVQMSIHGEKQSVQGKRIVYTFGENGMFGRLLVDGSIRFQGYTDTDKPEKEQKSILFTCSDTLHAYPDPSDPTQVKCDLRENVSFKAQDLGTMDAKQSTVWFNQRPRTSESKNPLARVFRGKPEFPVSDERGRQTNPMISPAKTTGNFSLAPSALAPDRRIGVSVDSPENRRPGDSEPRRNFTPKPGFPELTPDRARFQNDVRFEDENGFCTVRELRVFFYDGATNILPKSAPELAGAPLESLGPDVATKTTTPTAAAAAKTKPDENKQKRSFFGNETENGKTRFELQGDLMQMLVRMDGNQAEIEKIFIHKDRSPVVLTELNPQEPHAPIRVEGSELRSWYPSSRRTIVQILGEEKLPARFTGRDSELVGLDIVFSQQVNQFRVEGRGQFSTTQVALSDGDFMNDLSGKSKPTLRSTTAKNDASRSNGLLVVRWRNGMVFDGARIRFHDEVRAEYPLQKLECDILVIHLDKPISFVEPKSLEDPEVKLLECRGHVFFERIEFEASPDGGPEIQKAILRAEDLEQFRIIPSTGEFNGSSLGKRQSRLCATFRDNAVKNDAAKDTTQTGGGTGGIGGGLFKSPVRSELNRVDIRFFNKIVGNYRNFHATASELVNCTFYPVQSWNDVMEDDDTRALEAREGYRLSCDVLEVIKANNAGKEEGIEVTATGGTMILGKDLVVRSHVAKFNQLKNMIIIQGNGAIDAEVHFKRSSETDYEEAHGQQLEYNIETRNVNIKGGRGLKLINP